MGKLNAFFIGNEQARAGILAFLKKSSASSAHLFYGPEELGKKTFAKICSAFLLGVEPEKLGLHPDFLKVESKKEKTANITIDQARQVKNFLSLKPYFGKRKAVLIDKAQQLTAEAENALLKTLEEPPPDTYIFLTAVNLSQISDTIRSRVLKTAFKAVPDPELKKGLARMGFNQKDIDLVVPVSEQKPAKAISLLQDKSRLEKIKSIQNDIFWLIKAPKIKRFLYAQRIFKEGERLNDLPKYWVPELRAELKKEIREIKKLDDKTALLANFLRKLIYADKLMKTSAVNSELIVESLLNGVI